LISFAYFFEPSLGSPAMTWPPDETAQWIHAARAGSTEALGELLEACRFYLLGIADRELNPGLRAKGGASDLVQETFLEAQRDFANFSGRTEAELLAWLKSLLRHNAANFYRHYRGTAKRQASRELAQTGDGSATGAINNVADSSPTPSMVLMADEQTHTVRKAIEQLPDDYKQILNLRLEGKSFDEIGAIMGRTANAARKLWGRALVAFQTAVDSPS
jgi:RNA polymerase sigma-70 factor (ECF subfamily)